MCDFKGNLVAWLDGELSPSDAAAVDQHVRSCTDCRGQVSRFEQMSRDFATFYAGALAQPNSLPAKGSHRTLPWVSLAMAVAAMILITIWLAPLPDRRSPGAPQAAKAELPAAQSEPIAKLQPAAVPARHVRAVAKRRPALQTARQAHDRDLIMAQPTVRIAIPADALYPPGAVPQGMAYFANVSLAADGSVQAFRLER